MSELQKIHDKEVEKVNGGADGKQGLYEGPWKTVSGLTTGYLALRTEPYYSETNEIGELYNGQEVQVIGNDSGNGYTWVWAPTVGKSGWVNSSYLY